MARPPWRSCQGTTPRWQPYATRWPRPRTDCGIMLAGIWGSLLEVRLLLQGQDFANHATVAHTGSLNVGACAKNALGVDTVQNGATLGRILFLHLTLNCCYLFTH